MPKLKFLCATCVVTLALSTTQTQAYKTEEVLAAFSGLPECDGSKNAEEVCNKHCKGDGVVMKGACREQSIWDLCRTICRKDWIEECSQTASKHNLQGLAQCQ